MSHWLWDVKYSVTLLRKSSLFTTVALLFALVSLVLAAVGIYGVLAYAVSQRSSEIGIRMALGARPSVVLHEVLAQGARWIGLGLVLGIGTALGLGTAMRSLLYGVGPSEPSVYALVASLVAAIGLLACLAPSLRATRVDPAMTLRFE